MTRFFYEGKEITNFQEYEQMGTINKESHLYFLPSDDELLIYKEFKTNNEQILANKKAILNSIMNIPSLATVDNLVLPREIIERNGLVKGYLMPFIEGANLKRILNEPNIPFSVKKESLIKLGELLKKMKNYRYEYNKKIFLNDIHEDNFIIEYPSTDIKALDIDSLSIDGHYNSLSMYLLPHERLTHLKTKYVLEKENPIYGPQIIPNEDTEIYCYIIMILNFLYGQKTHFMRPKGLQEYLRYLEYLGYNKDLLNIFSLIYTENANINPVDYLDELVENNLSDYEHYYRYLQRH